MTENAKIRRLRDNAAEAGDWEMVAICAHALGLEPPAPFVVRDDGRLWISDYARVMGQDQSRAECLRVLAEGEGGERWAL